MPMNKYIYQSNYLGPITHIYQIIDLSHHHNFMILYNNQQYIWTMYNPNRINPISTTVDVYIYQLIDNKRYILYDYLKQQSYLIKLNDIEANQYQELINLIDFTIIKTCQNINFEIKDDTFFTYHLNDSIM